jgi:hypothetical protein
MVVSESSWLESQSMAQAAVCFALVVLEALVAVLISSEALGSAVRQGM